MLRNFLSVNKVFGGNSCTLWKEFSRKESTGTIGFIGLGNMGGPMATNFLKTNHKVVVYDVGTDATKHLTTAGAEAAATPAEVAEKSSQIITMLPNSSHVEEVYLGERGIISSVQKGSLLIDSSTIDPAVSRKVAAEASHNSATYVDAPVSGGVGAAKAATLTFMVGGEAADFQRASKLLQNIGKTYVEKLKSVVSKLFSKRAKFYHVRAPTGQQSFPPFYCKNVVHCGPVGTGQAAKLCNNMLLAISMIGVSEAMNLGIRLGLDPKVLAGIFNTSSGRCWASDTYNPVPGVMEGVPSSNNYQGGFGTALMYKDLGLAQIAAHDTQSSTPFGSSALQMYRLLCQHGYGSKDFSAVYQFLSGKDD